MAQTPSLREPNFDSRYPLPGVPGPFRETLRQATGIYVDIGHGGFSCLLLELSR